MRRQGKGRRVGLGDRILAVLNRLFQKDIGKAARSARGTVELNRLFQKDQGKTANVARILSPNPTRRPLPCLLIQSFFYAPW